MLPLKKKEDFQTYFRFWCIWHWTMTVWTGRCFDSGGLGGIAEGELSRALVVNYDGSTMTPIHVVSVGSTWWGIKSYGHIQDNLARFRRDIWDQRHAPVVFAIIHCYFPVRSGGRTDVRAKWTEVEKETQKSQQRSRIERTGSISSHPLALSCMALFVDIRRSSNVR